MSFRDAKIAQQLVAADRFARGQAPAGAAAAVIVEPTDRAEVRRELIHPNDGLGQERIIGLTDLLMINYLEFGLRTAKSVGRIHIRLPNGRTSGFGTGFLVTPTLLLTNHHVLESDEIALHSLVEFDFENDLNFLPKAGKLFRLDPARFFYHNQLLDFALVAVHPQGLDQTPLTNYPFLRLIEESGKALSGEAVSIIQHPDGADKQIALRNNHIIGLVDEFIHYETDTLPGSSGSPVLNDQWQVVALHHAGVPRKNSRGQILTKDGRVWNPTLGEDAIHWIANEGVRVSALIQHLRAKPDWQAHELRLLRDLDGLSDLVPAAVAGQPAAVAVEVAVAEGVPAAIVVAPPITLDEFYALVDHEETTEADLAPYLQYEANWSDAFDPVFRLNRNLVIDPSGLESEQALTFLNDWARNQRQRQYRRKLAANPNAIKIVAEGDSWFQFPFLLHDIVDHLMDRPDLAVFCVSAAGDHIRTMTNQAEFIIPIQQEQPEFFLISGGGNDLVGGNRLATLLHSFAAGLAPDEYPNSAFTLFEAEIRADYRRLFGLLTTRFPNLKILCHGYDYAIPRGGSWLGAPMNSIGIVDPALQRAIIRTIMDRMNTLYQQVAAEFANVTYLDLRTIVPANGWFDELHPRNQPFGDLASVFVDAIQAAHGP